MSKRGLRVFTIFGIDLFIDYSWFVIFVLVTWLLSARYFPAEAEGKSFFVYLGLGVVTSILFFLSAITHEFSHSIVAKRNKVNVKRITLFLFGGVSELFEEPRNADTEFKISIAGPTTSLLLALSFAILWTLLDRSGAYPLLALISRTVFQVNMILCIFNLLPGYPLDGGRILHSIIWANTRSYGKATKIATAGGRVMSIFIITWGVLSIIVTGFWGGLWLVLIGLFLYQAASQSFLEYKIKEALKNIPVSDLFNNKIVTINPRLSIDDALTEYFIKYQSQSFPVLENEDVIGVISLDDIRTKADILTENSRVEDVMREYPSHIYLTPQSKVLYALKLMVNSELSFIPVKKDDHFAGAIVLDEIASFLQTRDII